MATNTLWSMLGLLPKEGGGSLRRFLGIRNRLRKDQWNDSRPRRGPVPLFDFRRRDDAADLLDGLRPERSRGLFPGWRASDDSVIGGGSTSRMAFHAGAEAAGAPPFLRWSGTLSTAVNRASYKARHITRSGFAAIVSPEFPLGADLQSKYKALEICCRTDGRTYAVNLKVDTYFPGDLYQGFIGGEGRPPPPQQREPGTSEGEAAREPAAAATAGEGSLDVRQHIHERQRIARREDRTAHPYHGHPPAGFSRLILPFADFALTSRGRLRMVQRDLDGSINLESIGFTLMDGQDGDYEFDLASVRAVNVLGGEVVGSLEDDAREEALGERLRADGVVDGEGGDAADADAAEGKPLP